MLKKSISFLIVFAILTSLFTGTVAVAENAATDYFTFNDANLAQKYVDADGNSALSKITLNTDAEYTYGNAKYSGLLDLSNGNKWGTNKAMLTSAGMLTDWSGYDILRIRYYSTLADAYYSIFLTDSATSDSNRYRFTVKADKVGWQIAEIDLNRMLKSGSPSLSNIQTLQIRTDNNNDSTGGTSTQVGSGATDGLKFYFDSFWLEKYENEAYISFADDKVFDDSNWYKDDGTNSKGKLAVTTSTCFEGSGKAGKIELASQKWGTNYADLAKLGMATDWSEYDTLKIRFKSKIKDAFYTLFFYCTDSYGSGAQYKVKVAARNTDWNIVEIPFSTFKTKNSPSLDSIKYMQIRTDNNNDSGEQVGSGQVSGLTFYFDKIWLEGSLTAPSSSIEDGAENVPLSLNGNNEIVYTFDKELEAADYTDAVSVMEVVGSTETVTSQPYGVVSEGSNLIIRFEQPLLASHKYIVNVNSNTIASTSGIKLNDYISTSFATVSDFKVLSVTPENNTTEFDSTVEGFKYVVTFNNDLSLEEDYSDDIRVTVNDEVVDNVDVTVSEKTLNLTFALQEDSTYKVEFLDTFADKNGGVITEDKVFGFTTAKLPTPPEVQPEISDEPDVYPEVYFTFNDANLAQKYVDADGNSALSKITLNTDTEYTYKNAMYSGLLDLSNGNKWGTNKAMLTSAGMPTDWSGYDILRIRYYSTLADAYYSIFLTDSATSDSNRYRFTVKADKVGWQIAEIDLNRMLKSGSPSLSNIQTLQIRTDNNNDSTGGTSTQVGSGATDGLKFYFDSFWLEKYENEEYISFTDDKVFDDSNWYKDDGTNSKGKLAVTTTSYFAGSGKAGKIELTNQKWGTNHADLAKLGMTTDWTDYDTLKIRYKSKIQDAFYTIFFYCTDSYAGGGQYKVKVTARNADWNIIEIPLNSLKEKNSPSLDSIKYMQIRTDNNNDSGEQVGSGQVSGLTFYFDKIWLEKADPVMPHYFKYVHTNGEAVIRGIDALSVENQVDLVIPETIRGLNVVKIDSNAFMGNTNIVNLRLPSTLKEISDNAFSNCSKLLYITMPSCEKIRGSAFYGCTSLSVINSDYAGEVVFPKNLVEIKDGAFRSANVIRTVILPESLEKLGNVFYRTTGIKNIYFPETLPQTAYKKTFLGGSTDFKTVNAFGTKNSYIGTYALSEDAVDNYDGDTYEKSGKNLYNYIEENSDILVMNGALTVEGGKVGYNARLFNVGDENATLFGVIAVYNSNGTVLKGVNVVNNISVGSYSGTTLTDDVVYVDNISAQNNDIVKVMFWEDSISLKPVVTQNISLNVNIAE